jgi:plastocyanin
MIAEEDMKFWTSTIAAVVAVAAMGAPAFAKEHTVKMDKMKFIPVNLTVAKGDTIVWVNTDSQKQPHNVIAKNKAFTSKPVMMVNEKFTWKADKTGKHNYTCTIHPGMDGVITVK